jgi:transposase
LWLKSGLRCQKLHCRPRQQKPPDGQEELVSDDVMIAVDPHKASNTAAVLDPVTKTVIETARFANSEDGYAQLTAFTGRWAQRRWAVEGCHGAGRSLAQRLAADGETVLDVPAKLAARVRVYSRGHGRKTDKDDAVSVGLAPWTAPASPRSPVTVRW